MPELVYYATEFANGKTKEKIFQSHIESDDSGVSNGEQRQTTRKRVNVKHLMANGSNDLCDAVHLEEANAYYVKPMLQRVLDGSIRDGEVLDVVCDYSGNDQKSDSEYSSSDS